MYWVDELTQYLQNKIFVGGESVVEAFRSGKIFDDEEVKMWSMGADDETILTPILMSRLVNYFALKSGLYLEVEELIKPKHGEPSEVDGIYVVNDEESEELRRAIILSNETEEDCCYIIGLSKDRDSVIPLFNQLIWLSSFGHLHSSLGPTPNFSTMLPVTYAELGVFPAHLNLHVEEMMKTLFTNTEIEGNLRWDVDVGYNESGDWFNEGEGNCKGMLGYALKVSNNHSRVQTINWAKFPVSLL